MRKMILAAAVLAAMSGTAFCADDIAAPAAGYNWTGGYVGVVGSYQYGDFNWSERSIGAASESGDIDGFVGGLTGGFNYQTGNIVLGIEGDYLFGSTDGLSLTSANFNCNISCGLEIANFATLRGRVGYALDRSLIYGTAGWGMAEATAANDPTGVLGEDHVSGGVWGVGFEHAFTDNWTGKIEYLHADLGRLEIPTSCIINCFSDVEFDSIKFGLNYKF